MHNNNREKEWVKAERFAEKEATEKWATEEKAMEKSYTEEKAREEVVNSSK